MQPFHDYLKEQMEGVTVSSCGPLSICLDDPSDRDVVNDELADITDRDIVHPETVYEQVCQYLQTQGIDLPPVTVYADEFLEPGAEIILPLAAFDEENAVYLYFAFAQVETEKTYDNPYMNYLILAEIVTTNELEELLYEDPNSEPVQ